MKRFAYGRTLIMGVLCCAVLAIVFLSGCTADKGKVQYLLEAEGCTETVVGGWSMFGCSEKEDPFVNSFSCVKNGKRVSGYVCSGWFKGYTIRYE